MKRVCASVGLGAVLVAVAGTPVHAQAPRPFIEYRVTGTVSRSGRDPDVVLCSPSEEGLTIHTMGAWVFDFEVPSAAPGEHDARLRIAAPDSVTALHDNNLMTDDHLSGDAKLVVESAGRGQMNIPLLRIRFTASGLTSETGATAAVTGTIVCAVM
jgi:hypothetical protein